MKIEKVLLSFKGSAGAALLMILLLACPLKVFAIWESPDGSMDIGGSFRSIAGVFDCTRLPEFYSQGNKKDYPLQTIFRFTSQGRPSEFLSFEVHLVQSNDFSIADESGVLSASQSSSRYRALDVTLDWHKDNENYARLWLDRFNIKYSFPIGDLTIGRQAITFGKAYFWNPMDIFKPFEPGQLDRDYKPGVDGFILDIPLGNFSGVAFIGVLGPEVNFISGFTRKDSTWDSSLYGSSFLSRFYTNISEWDFSFQAGKVYGGYHVSGGAVGEIGFFESRIEAAYFISEKDIPVFFPRFGNISEDYLAGVIGVGRTFPNTFVFELEYFFNGAGDPDNLEVSMLRGMHGMSLNMSDQLIGLMLSYDILPIFIARFGLIYSVSDRSSQVQPSFFLSLSDEADLIVSATINYGKNPYLYQGSIPRMGSEFGSFPDIMLIEFKYYF